MARLCCLRAKAKHKIHSVKLPIVLQPMSLLTAFDRYKSGLSLWNRAFEEFMHRNSQDLSSKEMQGVTLLKIHYTSTKIMAARCPGTNTRLGSAELLGPKEYVPYLEDFQAIVDMSRPLIATAEQDTQHGKPPLTFSSDMGLIAPLYFTCVRCPDISIRSSAIQLLLQCPRREGMWNSAVIGQMIQEFWDLEARYKAKQNLGEGFGVDESGKPIPFSDHGAIHFAYFGKSSEKDSGDGSSFPSFKTLSLLNV